MIEAKKIKKIKALTSKNLLSEGETRIKPKALTQAVLSNIKFTENPLKGKKNLTQSFDVWEMYLTQINKKFPLN